MSDLNIRIEPRTRSDDLEPGLSARIYDPAWMLGRQWVFGEFDGEDGGTPVMARLEADVHRLTSLALPDGTTVDIAGAASPLDALIQAEPTRTAQTWTARERIAVGREFVRRLVEQNLAELVAAVVSAYPIGPASVEEARLDPAGARLLAIATGRFPDGKQLYVDGSASGRLTRLTVPPGREGDVAAALAAWFGWLKITHDEPTAGNAAASAWIPERLEHRFALRSASLPIEFRADEHRGGEIGWSSFNAAALTVAPTAQPERLVVRSLPTPVRFRGMPTPRLFQLEDASVDLGSVDAAPSDLARMAMMEYAFAFGNDVFALPLRIPFGTATTIASLRVTDTFGIETEIPSALQPPSSAGLGGFGLFSLTTVDGGRLAALVLPQAASNLIVGPTIEEVRLMRDEMINLVWAVEVRVEGGDGRPVVRAEPEARAAPPPGPPPADPRLVYRLQTAVPLWWFPLVLQSPANSGDQRMLRIETLAPSVEPPYGRLVALNGLVHEEEIPREGIRLERQRVFARWIDGSTHIWTRRLRSVGRSEGSSGLRFDSVEPAAASATT